MLMVVAWKLYFSWTNFIVSSFTTISKEVHPCNFFDWIVFRESGLVLDAISTVLDCGRASVFAGVHGLNRRGSMDGETNLA